MLQTLFLNGIKTFKLEFTETFKASKLASSNFGRVQRLHTFLNRMSAVFESCKVKFESTSGLRHLYLHLLYFTYLLYVHSARAKTASVLFHIC